MTINVLNAIIKTNVISGPLHNYEKCFRLYIKKSNGQLRSKLRERESEREVVKDLITH